MKYLARRCLLALAAVTALAPAACGGGGAATGSTCPADSTLGYSNGSAGTDGNFGVDFFTKYCNSCHSANASDRHDAPGNMNFDTEAEIMLHANDIDIEAAAGPAATNTDMPDLDDEVPMPPSDAERTKLGELIACEKAR